MTLPFLTASTESLERGPAAQNPTTGSARPFAIASSTASGWSRHEQVSVPFYMDGTYRAAVDLKPYRSLSSAALIHADDAFSNQ